MIYRRNLEFSLRSVLKLLITIISSIAITQHCKAADYTVEQWQMVEISFTSGVNYSDPFNNAVLNATFTNFYGTVITRPGFWDGSNIWRIHFAPRQNRDLEHDYYM